MDRIFHSWVSIFIFRFWYLWINKMDKRDLDFLLSQLSDVDITSKKCRKLTKRQYFTTYQSHFSIEINAHFYFIQLSLFPKDNFQLKLSIYGYKILKRAKIHSDQLDQYLAFHLEGEGEGQKNIVFQSILERIYKKK